MCSRVWGVLTDSGQIIATSHDLIPNGGLGRGIPLFQGNLGWWNIIIWPDWLHWLGKKSGPDWLHWLGKKSRPVIDLKHLETDRFGTIDSTWQLVGTPLIYHLDSLIDHKFLGGGNSNVFYFHPYLGKIPILTNIYQLGWNHQLDLLPRESWHFHPISQGAPSKLRKIIHETSHEQHKNPWYPAAVCLKFRLFDGEFHIYKPRCSSP